MNEKLKANLNKHYTIDPASGCWIWHGATLKVGPSRKAYPSMRAGKKVTYARKVSYTLAHGELPQGTWLMMTCGDRMCVNPDHMERKAIVSLSDS